MKAVAVVIISSMLVLGLVGVAWWYVQTQPTPTSQTPIDIIITKGQATTATIYELEKTHAIRSSLAMRLYILLHSIPAQFTPGTHTITTGKTYEQLLSDLSQDPKDIKVTFPEGWRREQFASRLANSLPNFDTQSFLNLTQNLEGQLFPDTYHFVENTSAQQIVATLTQTFTKKSQLSLNKKYGQYTGAELLVLASLVEREAKHPADRPKIASVLFNRLQDNEGLYIDAPIQYIEGSIRCKNQPIGCDYWNPPQNTQIDNPLNTYKYQGIPHAPICSPGLAAIQAILRPDSTPYKYYLTAPDGQTHFATTLQQHNLNVDKYLKH